MDGTIPSALVARALRYPYPAPPGPVRLTGRGLTPLPDPAALAAEGRGAVIAGVADPALRARRIRRLKDQGEGENGGESIHTEVTPWARKDRRLPTG